MSTVPDDLDELNLGKLEGEELQLSYSYCTMQYKTTAIGTYSTVLYLTSLPQPKRLWAMKRKYLPYCKVLRCTSVRPQAKILRT